MATKQKNTRKNKKVTLSSHVKSSLVYIAPHAHTGKRLAHHHTSHGLLLLILILAGMILFFSLASLEAAGVTKNGSLNVTATVPGDAPTVGATITSPAVKTVMKRSLAVIDGTCPTQTMVAVYNNGNFAGSTICTADNTFQVTIQLVIGMNTVQAQNYDSLNQAGPVTGQVQISYEPDVAPTPSAPIVAIVNTPEDIKEAPALPVVVAPQPAEQPCYDNPRTVSATQLAVWSPCITRNIFIGERLEMPVILQGGTLPYALSVDWGDSSTNELYSFPQSGRHILSHVYKVPKVKNISLKLADAQGTTSQMQTVVEVNGGGTASELVTGTSNPLTNVANIISIKWFEASVPVYTAVATLFVGFWIGDIFNRTYGKKKTKRRSRA